jgi:hypothetical protein
MSAERFSSTGWVKLRQLLAALFNVSFWPIADQRVHRGMSATDESGHCGNRVVGGF